jgi:hypothetical protein
VTEALNAKAANIL